MRRKLLVTLGIVAGMSFVPAADASLVVTFEVRGESELVGSQGKPAQQLSRVLQDLAALDEGDALSAHVKGGLAAARVVRRWTPDDAEEWTPDTVGKSSPVFSAALRQALIDDLIQEGGLERRIEVFGAGLPGRVEGLTGRAGRKARSILRRIVRFRNDAIESRHIVRRFRLRHSQQRLQERLARKLAQLDDK